MAQLTFSNSKGQERLVAIVHTYHDIDTAIDEFIADANDRWPEKPHFQRYYTRIWNEDDRTVFDVGSWSEFFYLDRPLPERKDDWFE